MRPGSVVGPQQNWLESVEKRCFEWGETERRRHEAKIAFASSVIHDDTEMERSDVDVTRNEGTSDVAKTTMGMVVPIQPYKKDRDFKLAENETVQEDVRQYNLRTRVQPTQTDYVSQPSAKVQPVSSATAQRRNVNNRQ